MIKFAVQSQTNLNKTYQVFLNDKGWHCSCPDFLFREKQKKSCKHILLKSAQLENFLIQKNATDGLRIEIYQDAL